MNKNSDIALLSIDPKWATAIVEGKKQYEFRRMPPTIDTPYHLLLFATEPVSAIVGEARVERHIKETVDELIDTTIEETPHDPEELREYFGKNQIGTALGIANAEQYDNPIEQTEIENTISSFVPPQNFMYLDSARHEPLLSKLPTYDESTVQAELETFS